MYAIYIITVSMTYFRQPRKKWSCALPVHRACAWRPCFETPAPRGSLGPPGQRAPPVDHLRQQALRRTGHTRGVPPRDAVGVRLPPCAAPLTEDAEAPCQAPLLWEVASAPGPPRPPRGRAPQWAPRPPRLVTTSARRP